MIADHSSDANSISNVMPSKTAEKPSAKTNGEPRAAEAQGTETARAVSPTRQRDLEAAISTITKTTATAASCGWATRRRRWALK